MQKWLLFKIGYVCEIPWGGGGYDHVADSLKVSIEIPVAIRHRRDMTEKLLKVTSNPNKQQQHNIFYINSIVRGLS